MSHLSFLRAIYLAFMIACCSFTHLLQGNLKEDWSKFLANEKNQTILELALKTRIVGKRQLPEDDKRLIAIEGHLQDYSAASVEESIISILEQEFNYQTSEVTFKNPSENSWESGRDLVYIVYNQSNEPILVAKGFFYKAGLAQELSSLEKLYQLNLTYSTTIAPLAIGKATIQERKIFWLIETVAAGKSLGDWALALKSICPENRPQQIEYLKCSLAKLGEALAELHMKANMSHSLATPQYSQFLSWMTPSNSYYKEICEEKDLALLEELESFCEELDKLVGFDFPSVVYVYLDLNWGNIFYDQISDQITFIDTNTLHLCLDPQGEPTMDFNFALLDYQIALNTLAYCSHFFSIPEIELLSDTYTSKYREKILLRSEESVDVIFFKVFTLLTFISEDCRVLISGDSTEFNEGKESEYRIKHIKHCLLQLNQLKSDFYNLN